MVAKALSATLSLVDNERATLRSSKVATCTNRQPARLPDARVIRAYFSSPPSFSDMFFSVLHNNHLDEL